MYHSDSFLVAPPNLFACHREGLDRSLRQPPRLQDARRVPGPRGPSFQRTRHGASRYVSAEAVPGPSTALPRGARDGDDDSAGWRYGFIRQGTARSPPLHADGQFVPVSPNLLSGSRAC
jgi:hypothetical protein